MQWDSVRDALLRTAPYVVWLILSALVVGEVLPVLRWRKRL